LSKEYYQLLRSGGIKNDAGKRYANRATRRMDTASSIRDFFKDTFGEKPGDPETGQDSDVCYKARAAGNPKAI
jgi:hypothetical protein